MKLAQLKLRQKLLVLLFSLAGVGLGAYVAVVMLADYQLTEKFVPENRALRDVEARSALLVQNYYRFMLTPDLISIEMLQGDLVLIRQSIDRYAELIAGQSQKEQLAMRLGISVGGLEQAGSEMIEAHQGFVEISDELATIEDDIATVFAQYRAEVSKDIGIAIGNQDWSRLTRDLLPELRMIDTVNQLFLGLFLQIREFQIEPTENTVTKIENLEERIAVSNTMFELFVAKSATRSQLSHEILSIYNRMIAVIERFTSARQKAEFAVSRAEQSGIDLNESMLNAIAASDSVGWKDLRRSLFLSSGVLFLTLVVGYLLIYAGLDRILRPLEKLQTVISRLGKGDFKQRSKDMIRSDEIGQLAGAFNHMADKLEESALQRQQFIEQLEQKNMELERFTYTVSHELKSPLVTANGFLGLLDRDLGDDKSEAVKSDMKQVESAIGTMNRQLDDLLELARVGRVVNPPQAFALTEVCYEVLDNMQGPITEAAANVEIEGKMPEVFADPVRIREVVQNLIENAIKFSRSQGQPHVVISAEAHDDDKVVCRVRDNGPGIDPKYHDKIFQLFDRLDSNIPGTGIGLALVKRIIEFHGGGIWVESTADTAGACFVFELPAAVPGP